MTDRITEMPTFENEKRDLWSAGDDVEVRRREALERRGGWGLGRGAVAPPQYGGLGAMPPKFFEI